LGGTLEYGNVWQAKRDISVHNALANGSAYFGADTPIGPLYVGVGFGQGGQRTGFLYLGSPY
jgi:NTE family protein